jgi:TonB family protein
MRPSLIVASVVFCSLWLAAQPNKQSDCRPEPGSVINNGVCVDGAGKRCASHARLLDLCYDISPQYTDAAEKAHIKGVVELSATVTTSGCATNIKITRSLGYGLDEAAVFALERFRFRKPSKPVSVNVEFPFDPQSSSRDIVTAPKCESLAGGIANAR